jgi:hypothetical protein
MGVVQSLVSSSATTGPPYIGRFFPSAPDFKVRSTDVLTASPAKCLVRPTLTDSRYLIAGRAYHLPQANKLFLFLCGALIWGRSDRFYTAKTP